MTTIGSVARQARKAKEWTQEDVSDRIGVTGEFFARIERGHALPSISTFARLRFLLGVKADALLGLEPLGELDETPEEDPPAIRRLTRRLRHLSSRQRHMVKVLLDLLDTARAASKRES